MDSYLIRIYRRSDEAGKEVAGLVERVGNGTRRAFGTSDELWSFLTEHKPRSRKRAKERGENSEK